MSEPHLGTRRNQAFGNQATTVRPPRYRMYGVVCLLSCQERSQVVEAKVSSPSQSQAPPAGSGNRVSSTTLTAPRLRTSKRLTLLTTSSWFPRRVIGVVLYCAGRKRSGGGGGESHHTSQRRRRLCGRLSQRQCESSAAFQTPFQLSAAFKLATAA